MTVETVKVYKGKNVVVCNKTAVEKWNEAGYFTSSQQKKAAEENKSGGKKELTAEEKKVAEIKIAEEREAFIENYVKEVKEARVKAGEPELTEDDLVKVKAFASDEFDNKDKE